MFLNTLNTLPTLVPKWVFPTAIMEEMIPEETEGVYFRCLSEELGCTYIAMNVFKDGSWWDEQTFDF